MTPDEGIDSLKSVIFHLESYDITTIRASVGKFWIIANRNFSGFFGMARMFPRFGGKTREVAILIIACT